MQIVFSETQMTHAPQRFLVRGDWKPCPEKPERATLLLEGLQRRPGGYDIMAPGLPREATLAAIAAVHDARYLHFLQTAHRRWRDLPGAAELVTPNVHPRSRTDAYPQSVIG